jgi:hypothetical protein
MPVFGIITLEVNKESISLEKILLAGMPNGLVFTIVVFAAVFVRVRQRHQRAARRIR